MNPRDHTPAVAAILVLAAAGLYLGWREFWFMTDDAYIAFRYASNSILGFGYVWNAAPFKAVEGYTSFLWVLILELIWRLLGILPPQSANALSLVFSYGTILLTAFAMMRMRLNEHLERIRVVLLALVLLGLLVNTTFLTWSSSGLETALFNFCFMAWMVVVIFGKPAGHRWRLALTASAAAVYLARPDGILVVLSTLALLLFTFWRDWHQRKIGFKWWLSVLPILIPPIHLVWRRAYYGEWLPNTYYAKYESMWPQSGIRYLASFILEYGVWVWIIALVVLLVLGWLRLKRRGQSLLDPIRSIVPRLADLPGRRLCTVIAIFTLCVQVGYYTFAVGGDHFEWRVYSHLPPLILLSFVYFLNHLNVRRSVAISALVILISFSVPIPWAHHLAENEVPRMPASETLQIRVADRLPAFLRPLSVPDDNLQMWLTDHLVCVRRREHMLFVEKQLAKYPTRELGVPDIAGKYPVAYASTVGVLGWVLPKVAIIDGYGLNDYIIARCPRPPGTERKMAHDRRPPEHYVASYAPNVVSVEPGHVRFYRRSPQTELTAEKIKALEKYWEDKIVRGINVPDSAAPFPIEQPTP